MEYSKGFKNKHNRIPYTPITRRRMRTNSCTSTHTCSTRSSKPLHKDEGILHRKLKPIGTVFVRYQTVITLVRERQT
jgi:hypothetical protein